MLRRGWKRCPLRNCTNGRRSVEQIRWKNIVLYAHAHTHTQFHPTTKKRVHGFAWRRDGNKYGKQRIELMKTMRTTRTTMVVCRDAPCITRVHSGSVLTQGQEILPSPLPSHPLISSPLHLKSLSKGAQRRNVPRVCSDGGFQLIKEIEVDFFQKLECLMVLWILNASTRVSLFPLAGVVDGNDASQQKSSSVCR